MCHNIIYMYTVHVILDHYTTCFVVCIVHVVIEHVGRS